MFNQITACMFAEFLTEPSTPEASAASLPPRLLQLLPAGAKVAGRDSHPLENSAFARRTKHPEVADALWALAASHSQQDPTFRTTLSYTRLTAAEALKQLQGLGFAEEVLPSPSTMAEVLNRNGYRLRPVLKAKPQKKFQRPMPSSPTSMKRTDKPEREAKPSD